MIRARTRPAGCAISPCVDHSRCVACSDCPVMETCPSQLFVREPRSNKIQISGLDGCMGCLACVTACPFDAVWSD